jgi:hypothetical protein
MKPFCDVLRALHSVLIHEVDIQSKNRTQTICSLFSKITIGQKIKLKKFLKRAHCTHWTAVHFS